MVFILCYGPLSPIIHTIPGHVQAIEEYLFGSVKYISITVHWKVRYGVTPRMATNRSLGSRSSSYIMASTASIQLRLHKSNTSPAPPRRTQSAEVAQSELLSPHTATGSRSSSPDVQLARPTTATSRASVSSTSSTQGTKEKKKKKAWNWLGHHKDKDEPDNSPAFWVSGHRDKVPYDVEDLLNARPVCHRLSHQISGI